MANHTTSREDFKDYTTSVILASYADVSRPELKKRMAMIVDFNPDASVTFSIEGRGEEHITAHFDEAIRIYNSL